jgi:hypothetical protein
VVVVAMSKLDLFCLWMLPFCFMGMAGAAVQVVYEPEPVYHAQRIVRQAKPETKPVVLFRRDGDWLVELADAGEKGWKP